MALAIHFDTELDAKSINLSGDDILSGVHPLLRGEPSMRERPSDVRLILKTADLKGQPYSFLNPAHPDNEFSTVRFDGLSAIMVMPEGQTARQQLFSALQIVDRLKSEGLAAVTPDFIQKEIENSNGISRKFIAEAYGPAPFDSQVQRLVTCTIPGNNGIEDSFKPIIEDSFALGMRESVKEEAYLVVYTGDPREVYVKGGDSAATVLTKMADVVDAKLKGSVTTAEALDPILQISKGIVLAVDNATGATKPLKLETAKDVFDLASLNIVRINAAGQVVGNYQYFPPNMSVNP